MLPLMFLNKRWHQVAILLGCSLAANTIYAEEFELAKTVENIPKKALIVKHDAKLYKSESSQDGEEAPFIQLYFLMMPEKNNRVPVIKTFSKNQTQPDGWLEKDSYVEWNTVQMINFEPQAGRERVKIYATIECAKEFSHLGKTTANCQELGEEPPQNPQSRLFVPIFQRQAEAYHGGFIRIYQNEQENKSDVKKTQLGYDLILVVDSTLSMGEYFQPTLRVLQSFLEIVQDLMQTEVAKPFNIGLLFYRDRKLWQDCDIGYLTHWAQPLTLNTEKVFVALDVAKATGCDSEDFPEAVFDGLYRAIVDTPWNSSHFKTILLIGDAPPNFDKNPMNFSVSSIQALADEKSIRFLTIKIGPEDDIDFEEFEALALQREAQLKGQFSRVTNENIHQFETDLMDALTTEWELFNKTQELSVNPEAMEPLSHISEYELPIIRGQLQHLSKGNRDFVKGWVPYKVKNKLAFGEYIFIRKIVLKLRLLIIESILTAAEAGMVDGGEAFLSAVREALAVHLKMKTEDIFAENETLGGILQKADILPFKTELLLFTPEEVNTWKPVDYEKLNQSLTEKLQHLREFSNNPNHLRLFEGVPYLYVPKRYFP
ncbi:MAG: hypothetical protein DRR19_17915 [Candidatus Parabeggiatoa sp. nov. 1]|nr:MAG: hypothetical protein DRR19_17915 [Gammaproteobacteria bacterium]